jgi:hypothetical protein
MVTFNLPQIFRGHLQKIRNITPKVCIYLFDIHLTIYKFFLNLKQQSNEEVFS